MFDKEDSAVGNILMTAADAARLYTILVDCVTSYSDLVMQHPNDARLIAYCRSRQDYISRVQGKMRVAWPGIEQWRVNDY